MTGAAVVLAFNSALCFGVALVLTHIGLRYIAPLTAAAISIPSSTLLFIAIAPIVLGGRPIVWAAVPVFAAVGLLYPAAVTLLTFAAKVERRASYIGLVSRSRNYDARTRCEGGTVCDLLSSEQP